MAPINSNAPRAAPPGKIDPVKAETLPDETSRLSLFGYKPDQRLLDDVFGRNAPRAPDAIRTPDRR